MATISHSNKIHEATVNLAEMSRQVAVQQPGATAQSIKAAEQVFYRAAIQSCLVNGNLESGIFRSALRDLGVGT